MRLICFWCAMLAAVAAQAQEEFYAPQTYRNHVRSPALLHTALFQPMHRPWDTMMKIPNRIDQYQKGLFTPAGGEQSPQGSVAESWRPAAPVREIWGGPGPIAAPAPILPKAEPWRAPFAVSKEQQASILHHKQALTSEGSFRFEYASDNGLAAGEVIEPDGSRVGAYQYKDPNGQLVKLKYRAGKDGFQILEGSHVPKSPEPVAPPTQDHHYQQAYEQQRRQYELQQQYNQQKPAQQSWNQGGGQKQQNYEEGPKASGGQYFVSNWKPGMEDDGQYRENEIEASNKGPHNFGEGYAFAFQG